MSHQTAELSAPDYARYGTDYRTYLEHFHLYLQAKKQMGQTNAEALYQDFGSLKLSEQDWTVTGSGDNVPPSGEVTVAADSESSSGTSTPISSTLRARAGKASTYPAAVARPDPEATTTALAKAPNPWVPVVRKQRSAEAEALTRDLTSRYVDKINGVLHKATDPCSFPDIVAYLDDVAQTTVIEHMARQGRLPNTWWALSNLRDQLIRVQKTTFKDPSKKVRVKDFIAGDASH